MAKYLRFYLKNFKGVRFAEIKVPQNENEAVVALVGLNESGKTTILEGISHFGIENRVVSSIFDRMYSTKKAASFIPISDKAAFDGIIEIAAEVSIEDGDLEIDEWKEILQGADVDISSLKREILIKKSLKFANSLLEKRSIFGI